MQSQKGAGWENHKSDRQRSRKHAERITLPTGYHRSCRAVGVAVGQFGEGGPGEMRRGALEQRFAQNRRSNDAKPPPQIGISAAQPAKGGKARPVRRHQKRGRAGFFFHARQQELWNWPAKRSQAVDVADEQSIGVDGRLKGHAEFMRNGPVERPLFDNTRSQQLAEEGGSMGAGARCDAKRVLERHPDTVENGLPIGKLRKEKSGKEADAGLARWSIGIRKTDAAYRIGRMSGKVGV